MFRVRRAWWSGNPILQTRLAGKWQDAEITKDLETGFYAVGEQWIADNDATLTELHWTIAGLRADLDAIKATRSLAAKAGWAKKKAPVLMDVVSPLKTAAECVAAEREIARLEFESAERAARPPVDEAGKPIYTPRGPYPRSPQC